jgi:hypothetical protein
VSKQNYSRLFAPQPHHAQTLYRRAASQHQRTQTRLLLKEFWQMILGIVENNSSENMMLAIILVYRFILKFFQ